MNQRVLPEWSGEKLEYVEPTQVVRSFGYDVFANPVTDETMALNEETIVKVLQMDGEVNTEQKHFKNETNAAAEIKAKGLELGAEMVGITLVDQRYVYKGHDLPHKYAIILASRMDYDEMKYAATERHVKEVIRSYAEMGTLAAKLSAYIRELGYPARAHSLRFEQLSMIPHAVQAGIGQLGKHGSLINEKMGCSFRLSAVTTDLPLVQDSEFDYGVEDFCKNCNMCVRHCPGDAIAHDKQEVRGVFRWTVDTEACAPFWGSYYSCGICLEVCPANAKSFDGEYKQSFIERIKQHSVEERTQQLKENLQKPWTYAIEPEEKTPGWRNRVKGKGPAEILMQGIPNQGLPDEIYHIREAMGIKRDDRG